MVQKRLGKGDKIMRQMIGFILYLLSAICFLIGTDDKDAPLALRITRLILLFILYLFGFVHFMI